MVQGEKGNPRGGGTPRTWLPIAQGPWLRGHTLGGKYLGVWCTPKAFTEGVHRKRSPRAFTKGDHLRFPNSGIFISCLWLVLPRELRLLQRS